MCSASSRIVNTLAYRPELLPELLKLIDVEMDARYGTGTTALGHSSVVLRRCLEAMNAILKEFGQIKMLSGVGVMAKVSRVAYDKSWVS